MHNHNTFLVGIYDLLSIWRSNLMSQGFTLMTDPSDQDVFSFFRKKHGPPNWGRRNKRPAKVQIGEQFEARRRRAPHLSGGLGLTVGTGRASKARRVPWHVTARRAEPGSRRGQPSARSRRPLGLFLPLRSAVSPRRLASKDMGPPWRVSKDGTGMELGLEGLVDIAHR